MNNIGSDSARDYIHNRNTHAPTSSDRKKNLFRQMAGTQTKTHKQKIKPSQQYMKRDETNNNGEVFCKISSHLGDVDNDPHTPKSNGSLKSSEKKKKKGVRSCFEDEKA